MQRVNGENERMNLLTHPDPEAIDRAVAAVRQVFEETPGAVFDFYTIFTTQTPDRTQAGFECGCGFAVAETFVCATATRNVRLRHGCRSRLELVQKADGEAPVVTA